MTLYNDSVNFEDYVKAYTFSNEDDKNAKRQENSIPSCLAQFIQSKYGTIKNFYSPQIMQNEQVLNGFTRIEKLRRALGALDRSGWDRSYHQRIFHVSLNHFRI